MPLGCFAPDERGADHAEHDVKNVVRRRAAHQRQARRGQESGDAGQDQHRPEDSEDPAVPARPVDVHLTHLRADSWMSIVDLGILEVDALGPGRVALERRLDLQLLVALHVDLLGRSPGGDTVDGDLRARRRRGEDDGPAGAVQAFVNAGCDARLGVHVDGGDLPALAFERHGRGTAGDARAVERACCRSACRPRSPSRPSAR